MQLRPVTAAMLLRAAIIWHLDFARIAPSFRKHAFTDADLDWFLGHCTVGGVC
jgi:hypothetical protein